MNAAIHRLYFRAVTKVLMGGAEPSLSAPPQPGFGVFRQAALLFWTGWMARKPTWIRFQRLMRPIPTVSSVSS